MAHANSQGGRRLARLREANQVCHLAPPLTATVPGERIVSLYDSDNYDHYLDSIERRSVPENLPLELLLSIR